MAKEEVQLTQGQKVQAIKYHLSGCSKGLFEDCEEFWEGMTQDQIDQQYPALSGAAETFMMKVRDMVIEKIKKGEL